MTIDSHVHFWRYDAREYGWIDDSMAALRRDFLPTDVAGEMARTGIDRCIAVQARQSLEETDWLLSLADKHPYIAGVIGWVDLQAHDVRDQLERYAGNSKLVGIRHIVQSEPDDRFLVRPAFCRGISLLGDLELAYDILIYPKHLAVAAEFISRFRTQRFVIDHLAKPVIRGKELDEWERRMRVIAAFPHVYCKVSGLVTEADWKHWTPGDFRPYLDVVFDCFGPYRLIAGSDWPVCTVAAAYGSTMSILTDYLSDRSDQERAAVMGGNAERFWNLRAEIQSRPDRAGELV
jgi:L-fucono-1,5-lactonase